MIPFSDTFGGWDSDAVARWMRLHGVVYVHLVQSFTIEVNYGSQEQWVTFQRYAVDEHGHKYTDKHGDSVMDDPFSVPLLCLPPIYDPVEVERMYTLTR